MSIDLRALTLVASLGLSPPVAAGEETFVDYEEVIAADIVIELDEHLDRKYRKGEVDFQFEVLVDGQSCPVVGVESASDRVDDDWTLVLYFDLDLLSTSELRRAAGLLVPVSADLVALGKVEIVLADPVPRRALPPTRDERLLETRLAALSLRGEGRDRLRETRAELGELAGTLEEGMEIAELWKEVERAEADGFALSLDRSLLQLVDRRSEEPRRAVFLVIGSHLVSGGDGAGESQALGSKTILPDRIVEAAESYGQTLSSFNWIVFPMAPPPPREDREAGWRLGKWRFFMKGLLFGTYEEDRDPELARSYAELGRAHREGERLQEASEAYRKAIFHFQADPKTEAEEIEVLEDLAEVLADLGRKQQSRDVSQFVSELRANEEGSIPPLSEELFGTIAETSAGQLIRDESDLSQAIASLERRLRLTYQRSSDDERSLLPMSARVLTPEPVWLRAPAFTRRSTPETVPAARANALLFGDPILGDLEFAAFLESEGEASSGRGRLIIELTSSNDEWTTKPTRWRLTLLSRAPGRDLSIMNPALAPEYSDTHDLWADSVEIDLGSLGELSAVVVEELRSGLWGAILVDQAD